MQAIADYGEFQIFAATERGKDKRRVRGGASEEKLGDGWSSRVPHD